MISFVSLHIRHFLSFREPVTLPLENQGLVLVRGDNRLSAACDANGVGKSAIFDALCWVLYGVTLRGFKADEVACRFTTEPCVVRLEFVVNGVRWLLERGRRPTVVVLGSE